MSTTNLDLWNKLCEDVAQQKISRMAESSFQKLFEDFFAALGWVRFTGEIDPQRTIPIGAANSIKPDIIIRSGGKDLYVVELKKPSIESTDRHSSQLKSYMLQMKLPLGVFFGESIKVFYDNPGDNVQPIEITSIEFSKNNAEGIELLTLLSKEGFGFEAVQEYYAKILSEREKRKLAERIVDEITENAGIPLLEDLLKKHLIEEYDETVAKFVLGKVQLSMNKKRENTPLESKAGNKQAKECVSSEPVVGHKSDPILWNGQTVETSKRDTESFQDFVKRTLDFMFSNNMIPLKELELLQTKEYSKKALSLEYALLEQNHEKTFDGTGKSRYWAKPLFGNKYYACSQWWRQKMNIYEPLFENWVIKIVELNKN